MLDDLEEIRAFKLVIAQGSIAGAARCLSLSPAAVGKRLASLERKTDRCLIQRTTRKLSITEDGSSLLKLIEPIIAAVDAAEEQMSHVRKN